jgi:hypothetical protein
MPAVQMLLSPAVPARSLAQARRAAFVVPVLLLHVALLWLLTQAHPDRSDLASAQATKPMVLRWIEAVTPSPRVQPAPVRPSSEAAPAQPPRVVSRAITQAAPNSTSVTQPSESVAAPTTTDITPAPTATTTPSPATIAPLDLTLRRGVGSASSMRSPASLATQDSRANTARAAFGEKLAEALGSEGRSSEENLGDGRIRLRSAADCVIVVESRAGQLDPMSQTSRPAPRGVKPCK